jgi:hypothetical protein
MGKAIDDSECLACSFGLQQPNPSSRPTGFRPYIEPVEMRYE